MSTALYIISDGRKKEFIFAESMGEIIDIILEKNNKYIIWDFASTLEREYFYKNKIK